jgi:hypothetical protein
MARLVEGAGVRVVDVAKLGCAGCAAFLACSGERQLGRNDGRGFQAPARCFSQASKGARTAVRLR